MERKGKVFFFENYGIEPEPDVYVFFLGICILMISLIYVWIFIQLCSMHFIMHIYIHIFFSCYLRYCLQEVTYPPVNLHIE